MIGDRRQREWSFFADTVIHPMSRKAVFSMRTFLL